MKEALHIRTDQFPILDGEEEEIINPGTFGKSFAQYIEKALKEAEYEIPFICCEDWGWWVEVSLPSKSIGIGCHRQHDENKECEFSCAISIQKMKVWSWKRFRFVDISTEVEDLMEKLENAFRKDPDIELIDSPTDKNCPDSEPADGING